MKKKLALILAISVAIIVAVTLLLFPTAEGATTLDLSIKEGITFDNLGLWLADEPMEETPASYEAWVYLPADWEGSEPGSIMGNYKGAGEQGFRFRLRKAEDGTIYPNLMYTFIDEVPSNSNKQYISYNFSKAIVPTDEWVHIAIVDDGTNGFRAYINGEMMHSAKQTEDYAALNKCPYNESYHFVIGAEQATGSNPFKGKISSVAVFKDVRTEAEIQSDMASLDLTDTDLISAYSLNVDVNGSTISDATGNYNVTHNRRNSYWATPEEMPALEDYEYSIAIIGDTQAVNKYYPEYMPSYFDWLLDNKDEHKIQHVLNLGDITNNNEDAEWDRARDNFFRLNGIIDYTLVRGDHDVLLSNSKGDNDVSNDTLPGGDAAKYDRWFDVPAYTDRFTNSEDADYYVDPDVNKTNGSITNSYRVVNIGTQQYLIVTMDKYPSETVLNWLDEGITAMTAKYPDIKIIMTMHCFIGSNGEYISGSGGLIGQDIWDRIKGYANLEYVICGHDYAWGPAWLKEEAADGHIVNQLLFNPQGPEFDWQGASAMIGMLYFQADGDVEVRYYSPTVDRYYIGNKNPVNSPVSGEKYKLESSMFTINPNDDSVAVQLTRENLVSADYFESNTKVTAASDGSNVDVNYTTDDVDYIKNGKISIEYDSEKLSNPIVTPSTLNVDYYDGKLIVEWSDYTPETEGTLFAVAFDSTVMTGEYAIIGVDAKYVGYSTAETTYYDKSVEAEGTIITAENEMIVYYEAGDNFKEKVEEALEVAKYTNVKLVMKSDYTATANTVFGDVDSIPQYTVYITSDDTSTPATIATGTKALIFAGKFNIDHVIFEGGDMATNGNALFFPEGAKGVIGSNITEGSTKVSVCGDYVEINSGSYHYVGGAIINGYTVTDPTIKLQGTAKGARVVGGICGYGNVLGTSTVYVGDSAAATNYLSPSSYAVMSSSHSGVLTVDSTGTFSRICGMLGPCGGAGDPHYEVIIENANVTTALVGAHIFNKNSVANGTVEITVNGGTFANVYAGMSVTSASYTGTKLTGSTTITINDGKFTGGVYNAGAIFAANAQNQANATMTIKGGDFDAGVFGGALLKADNVVLEGTTTLNVQGGTFASLIYGSSAVENATAEQTSKATLNVSAGTFESNVYFYGGSELKVDGAMHSNEVEFNVSNTLPKTTYGGSNFVADGCSHIGKTTFTFKDGTYAAGYIYGGSNITDGKNGTHSGEVVFTLEDGTFSSEFFGGSLLQNERAHHSGKITFSIYGGTSIGGHISGGSKLWFNGTGYYSEGGNGVRSSGEVFFNIYNKNKAGAAATVSLASGKRLYCSAYGTSTQAYREIANDTTYLIQGVTLPTAEAYGGMRANSAYDKITGDINGTLEDLTIANAFYGGSNLSAANTTEQGDITLTLNNVNVTGTVAAGSRIANATATKTGKSTLNYNSGALSGEAVGGCYFEVANVRIDGDSKLVFGTSTTAPTAAADSKLIGGSLAAEKIFTGDEATSPWGMYGSSDLVIKGGTVAANTYVVGGSFLDGATAGLWANYPYVGGAANSKEHQKLTIEGGTVAGPRLYAGSYCNAGGQDHGTVELEINGGTINLKTTDNVGIYNYGALKDAIYPATYYPVNTKSITVNHVFTFIGGKLDLFGGGTTNVSGGPCGYNGTVTGNTELTLNVEFANGSSDNASHRVVRTVGGLVEFGEQAQLIGNSTLNILGGYVQPTDPITAGCYSSSTNRVDEDTEDGILHGFVQVGDVTLNISGGTVYRSTCASGYRANVDGNVFVNISGGQISRDIAGMIYTVSASAYSSVTGDIAWNISGGTITGGSYVVYGGAYTQSSYTPAEGYNVIGGNIYMEISGGTITGTKLSLIGTTTLKDGKEARLKLVGEASTVMPAVASENCVLDLTQYTGSETVSTTNFDKVYNPMKDQSMTISGFDPANAKFTDLATLTDKTFTWNGSTATYAELTAFDNYSNNKNALCIVDANNGNVVEGGIFGSTGDVKVKCGNVTTAPLGVSTSVQNMVADIKSNYEIVGTGIRTTNLAFRCRARVDQAFFNEHTAENAEGFTIVKLGILVSTKSDLLVIGGSGVLDAWSWANGAFNSDIGGGGFATDGNYADSYLFQAAITGYGTIDALDAERANAKLSFRAYMIVEQDGVEQILYFDNPADNTQTNYTKSLYDTALQIKTAAESDEDSVLKDWYNALAINAETITKIIEKVENAQ